jgi:ribosomal protein L7/L12
MNDFFIETILAVIISIFLIKFVFKTKPDKNNRRIFLLQKDDFNSQEIEVKARELIQKGQKLEAIKIVRELTGMELKDSKEYVDVIALGKIPILKSRKNLPNDELINEIRPLLEKGNKIEAIRQVRILTDMSLKDAKDFVDSINP